MAENELARSEGTTALAPMGIYETLPVEALVQRVDKIREVYERVLKRDVHYGEIPGTRKKKDEKPRLTLLKPGAQMLCTAFLLCPEFEVVGEIQEEMHVAYTVRCTLIHIPSGMTVATGLGSCSSWEKKYRYRVSSRTCPACGTEAIIKGKAEYGGGWICFKKKNGCGAKYSDGDPAIVQQETGRVMNEDQHDQANTLLKMAEKRSLVGATLNATGASSMFTQDLEDHHHGRPPAPENQGSKYGGTPQGQERPRYEQPNQGPPREEQPQEDRASRFGGPRSR